MSVFEIIGGAVILIVGVMIALLVLMQEGSRGGGLSSLGGSESYMNKNQARTRDSMLSSATRFMAIVFVVMAVALYAVERILG